MEALITAAPRPRALFLHRRDGTGSNIGSPSSSITSSSALTPQTTRAHLATATNAPASASTTAADHTLNSFLHLPTYAYICIGLGVVILLTAMGCIGRRRRWIFVPVRGPTAPPSHPPIDRSRYFCRHCCTNDYLSLRFVMLSNPNGNGGRPYFVCTNPECPNRDSLTLGGHEVGWVSWADNIGVRDSNPSCACPQRYPLREDRSGQFSTRPFHRFWTCQYGACGYFSWYG